MPKRKTPYRSKVKIGVDAAGKPINKWIQGRTRDELDKARKAVIAYYITGTALADDRLFGDYASEWYHVRKEPTASASTRESYRTALNKDLFPVFGNRMLRAISSMELQTFLNGYAGRSGTKVTVLLAALRGIFASAKADRLIAEDPTASLTRPTTTKAAPKSALTEAQRQALVSVCSTHPDGHYLALMYYLGVRPGEARGLQWQDIDWQASLVHVVRDIDYKAGTQAGALKTEASRRDVPLPEPLAAILRPLRDLPYTYIAHAQSSPARPLAKTVAERLWVELMASAGLVELPEETTLESIVTKYDIGNPKGLEFQDVNAELAPTMRDGAAFVVINGNNASLAHLNPNKDAVYYEQPGSQAAEAYVNIFAVKPENAEADFVKALEKVVYTQKVYDLIVNSGFTPVFEVPAE